MTGDPVDSLTPGELRDNFLKLLDHATALAADLDAEEPAHAEARRLLADVTAERDALFVQLRRLGRP